MSCIAGFNNKTKWCEETVSKPQIIRRSSPLKYVTEYLMGKCTPSRIMCDISIKELGFKLEGVVVELGATNPLNYSRFAISADNYIVTNIDGECDQYVDMMNLPYYDNSIDAFVNVAALEHVSDPWKAIEEMHRVLKPSGKILIVAPFIYPFHAAPDDYYRFSPSALLKMFQKFKILRIEYLGGRESTIALLLQFLHGSLIKRVFGRMLGLLFYLLDCRSQNIDDSPILFTIFAEKGAD